MKADQAELKATRALVGKRRQGFLGPYPALAGARNLEDARRWELEAEPTRSQNTPSKGNR